MKKALVIGSTCADVRIELERLPGSEEDISTKSQTVSAGGCAYNVASAIHYVGVDTLLFSPVGTGVFGEFIRRQLAEKNIDIAISVEEENGSCYCMVEPNGDRTFMSIHGAEYHFKREWFDNINIDEYGAVYFCGLEIEEETGEAILSYLEEVVSKKDIDIYYAPGPRGNLIRKDRQERIYAFHPIIHLNKREAEQLLDIAEQPLLDVAKQLSALTGNEVLVTDGAHGACNYNPHTNEYVFVESEKVPQIDGTGAGDAHIGAFIAARLQGKDRTEALQEANHLAGKVVQIKGSSL